MGYLPKKGTFFANKSGIVANLEVIYSSVTCMPGDLVLMRASAAKGQEQSRILQ